MYEQRRVVLPFPPRWMLLLILALATVCSAREKKDTIVFANGDHMTCEIIKLEKGYLYVKLDYADGTVALDWSKISHIESPQSFVIADKTGNRYSGGIQATREEKDGISSELMVTETNTSRSVSKDEVVEIDQTDSSFWQNLHGGIDVGFNYTKQQNRAQYSFDSSVVYARAKWSTGADDQSSFSGGGGVSNLRNDLRLNVQRQLRSPRNFYLGTAEFLHNGEQDLSLRTTVGGALGHYFRRTNNSLVGTFGGVVWNREKYSSAATMGQTGDSGEAVIGTQLNYFKFKTTNYLVDARVYPSLTDLGRTRLDLNASLKLKLAKDLYWNLSYYLNVDSRPPQGLAGSDYGTTSSLGWKF
jgi:Protein of unknown function, DUF481